MCRRKKFGGMGILDIHQMNNSLLAKWLWRFKDPTCHSLWKDIIRYKYYDTDHPLPFSSFWKDVLKKEQISSLGTLVVPGSHGQVFFWHDHWHGN